MAALAARVAADVRPAMRSIVLPTRIAATASDCRRTGCRVCRLRARVDGLNRGRRLEIAVQRR